MPQVLKKKLESQPGADLAFSRRGIFRKFPKTFLGRPFLLRALPNDYQDLLTKCSAPKANFWPKAFLGTLWKVLTKKLRVFGARCPSNLLYFGAVKEKLRSVSLKMVLKGDLLGRQWVELREAKNLYIIERKLVSLPVADLKRGGPPPPI